MSNELTKKETTGLAPSTVKELLETWAPSKCLRSLSDIKTVRQALQIAPPSLGALRRQFGEKPMEAYIKLWLVHLNDLIDLKNPLSEERIDYIAIQVVNKYHNLTIADIYPPKPCRRRTIYSIR